MDIDIYKDIPDFDLCKEFEKVQGEHNELTRRIDEMTKELGRINRQNHILQANLSILLKTARSEIDRKDRIIADLRKKMSQLLGKNTKDERGNNRDHKWPELKSDQKKLESSSSLCNNRLNSKERIPEQRSFYSTKRPNQDILDRKDERTMSRSHSPYTRHDRYSRRDKDRDSSHESRDRYSARYSNPHRRLSSRSCDRNKKEWDALQTCQEKNDLLKSTDRTDITRKKTIEEIKEPLPKKENIKNASNTNKSIEEKEESEEGEIVSSEEDKGCKKNVSRCKREKMKEQPHKTLFSQRMAAKEKGEEPPLSLVGGPTEPASENTLVAVTIMSNNAISTPEDHLPTNSVAVEKPDNLSEKVHQSDNVDLKELLNPFQDDYKLIKLDHPSRESTSKYKLPAIEDGDANNFPVISLPDRPLQISDIFTLPVTSVTNDDAPPHKGKNDENESNENQDLTVNNLDVYHPRTLNNYKIPKLTNKIIESKNETTVKEQTMSESDAKKVKARSIERDQVKEDGQKNNIKPQNSTSQAKKTHRSSVRLQNRLNVEKKTKSTPTVNPTTSVQAAKSACSLTSRQPVRKRNTSTKMGRDSSEDKKKNTHIEHIKQQKGLKRKCPTTQSECAAKKPCNDSVSVVSGCDNSFDANDTIRSSDSDKTRNNKLAKDLSVSDSDSSSEEDSDSEDPLIAEYNALIYQYSYNDNNN